MPDRSSANKRRVPRYHGRLKVTSALLLPASRSQLGSDRNRSAALVSSDTSVCLLGPLPRAAPRPCRGCTGVLWGAHLHRVLSVCVWGVICRDVRARCPPGRTAPQGWRGRGSRAGAVPVPKPLDVTAGTAQTPAPSSRLLAPAGSPKPAWCFPRGAPRLQRTPRSVSLPLPNRVGLSWGSSTHRPGQQGLANTQTPIFHFSSSLAFSRAQ